MIDHSRRLIFIHIPKTAGKSILEFFGMRWQNHKDLLRYSKELEPRAFKEYFKFTVVRNPWDRILSEYQFQKKKSGADPSNAILRKDGKIRTFSEWLTEVLANPHSFPPKKWGGEVSSSIHRFSPQVDWLTVDRGVGVNCVLHMENLEKEFVQVTKTIEMPPAPLPCRNWNFHWHYSHYYDRHSREVVGDYYKSDIEAFGYKFEPIKQVVSWLPNLFFARMRYLITTRLRLRRPESPATGKNGQKQVNQSGGLMTALVLSFGLQFGVAANDCLDWNDQEGAIGYRLSTKGA